MIQWQQNRCKTIQSDGILEKNNYYPIVLKQARKLQGTLVRNYDSLTR